jgi:hypothetical protein
MSKNFVQNTAKNLITSLGRQTAHFLYPNEIDYYFIAFELVDSQERTVQYFAFPVNPKSIMFNDPEATKVQRTLGGITSLKTTTFDPKNYTIQGDFGRNFKRVIGGNPFSFSALNFGFDLQALKLTVQELSIEVKSGYGCIKLFERIIKRAKELDEEGNPYKLYFYNTSLNQQYLVEPQDLNFTMDIQNNMIWNYNFRFVATARIEDVVGGTTLKRAKNLTLSVLNAEANNVARKLKLTNSVLR